MSFQAALDNRTPFAADKIVLPDKDGQEAVLIVASASFGRAADGSLELLGEQTPPRVADVFTNPDAAARSSIRYEADIALEKPLVDVLLNGDAYARGGRPATSVPVRLSVGDIRKELLVTGDRSASDMAAPAPFVSMPIVYERAFGGTAVSGDDPPKYAVDRRNPIGIGFRGARSADAAVRSELPNIEYLRSRMSSASDTVEVAGFGAVGRGWTPRIEHAGTYDDAWLKQRWPLLPADFDAKHYQAAPADQQSASLQGGEAVQLVNLTPDGLWEFRLPVVTVPLLLMFSDRSKRLRLRLDTVMLEPSLGRVTMTLRASIRTARNRGALREIVVGYRSPAYIRARFTGKTFLDRIDGDGGAPGRYFQL